MKPEDFPQFADPRVRAVMAAAANLTECLANLMKARGVIATAYHPMLSSHVEKTKAALFAAQHSKPKTVPESLLYHTDACQMVHGYGDGCPRCQHILKTGEYP